jgi:uncharacterized protein
MSKTKILFNNSKGQKLVGDFYKPDLEDYPIVIFVHGYTSDKSTKKGKCLGELLPKQGMGVFVIDLSGRGESEGTFEDTTITQYIDDVKCAIDTMTKYSENIGLMGSSLGGLVSLQEVSKDPRINALLLFSPVSVFPHKSKRPEFSQEGLKDWKEIGFTFVESGRFGKLKLNYNYYEDGLKYGNYNIYKEINIPVFIIHGDADNSVLIEETKELLNYLKDAELFVLEGANHHYSDEVHFQTAMNKTVDFFVSKLK